jgi:adenosylcobinamide kinase / adenosylcobinamide-phosphate guanylyltransferase
MSVTLVIGGARSGKSRRAEALVEAMTPPFIYLATAQAFDGEMAERIAVHQARRDHRWTTIEAPIELGEAIAAAAGPLLVDCLTLWLSNLMLADHDLDEAFHALDEALAAAPHPVVLVSNEVGLGIVPENALARRFRDAQGRLNQAVAARADRVIFMVAGLALEVK